MDETLEKLAQRADTEMRRLAAAQTETENAIFGELGVEVRLPVLDGLETLRDLIAHAETYRENVINTAITNGFSDRAIATASGLSAPAIGRRRRQTQD